MGRKNFLARYDFGFTIQGAYATINHILYLPWATGGEFGGEKPRLKRKGDCLGNCVRG